MVILLDVDGVIANFIGLTLEHLPGNLKEEDVTGYDICEALSLSPSQRMRLQEIWQGSWFPSEIMPYHGAQDFVLALRALGDVYAVTAPMEGSIYWQGLRAQWLKDYFGLTNIVSTNHKHLIRGDVMIDDNAEHLATTICPFGILFARPWNKIAQERGWGAGGAYFTAVTNSYEGILQTIERFKR